MPNSDPDYSYDVFISYSHKDQEWVWNWLVPRLKQDGFAVCTDRESFDPGVPSLINMENAVASSRHTVLVLTPASVQTEWTNYEALLVQHDDPVGLRQRTLPVLRQPCELPRRIGMLTYINLTDTADKEAGFARLVDALRGVRRLPGANRPQPAAATPTKPANTIASPYNSETVRELLRVAFSDSELTTLCFDHFRSVYEDFSTGMGKSDKIQRLVEYCERQGEMESLLAIVQRTNPFQYGRFRNRFHQT